jgi:hypothetical protein
LSEAPVSDYFSIVVARAIKGETMKVLGASILTSIAASIVTLTTVSMQPVAQAEELPTLTSPERKVSLLRFSKKIYLIILEA